MGQGIPSVEPSIPNSPPAVDHEWYKSQPRTRQCAEDIERLCMFLSGAAARVSQIVCAVVRRDEPRPCAIPDALLDAAIEFAQHAKDDAEQLIVRVRGVWTEIPSAVSFDPRGWETDLLMRLEQARLDAGCVALTLWTRKGGWPVSVQEAQEWKTELRSHIGPLMERRRVLCAIPDSKQTPAISSRSKTEPPMALKPSETKAGASFQQALAKFPDLRWPEDKRPLYDWASEHCYQKKPPDFETWCRYVRSFLRATNGVAAKSGGARSPRSAVPRRELADIRQRRNR